MTLRIMWLSDRIMGGNSAYTKVTHEMCTRLAKMGYKVGHTPMGRANKMGIWEREGVTVYPSGDDGFGEDVAVPNYLDFKANILITLKEPWCFSSLPSQAINWVPHAIIDHSPVSSAITSRIHTAFKTIVISRFAQRELKQAGISEGVRYIPHGCLDGDTSIWVRGDETVGVVDDVSVTSRITGVWKVPLQESIIELITPRRSLKITKDNLVLTERGWKPAGDVEIEERVAVVRAIDEDLYTKVGIRQFVETYELKAMDGGRGSGSPGKLSENSLGASSQNAQANLVLSISKSQTVGAEKKDEGLPWRALVGGGQGKAQVVISINAGLRACKPLPRENLRCHLPAIVEARGKAKEEDCSVAYQSEFTPPSGGVEMGIPSGVLGWGRDHFCSEDASRIPIPTPLHYEHQLSGLKNDQGLDRGLCDLAFFFRTFKDLLLQALPNIEQRLLCRKDDSPISFREEETSGNDTGLLRFEEGKVNLIPTYGEGASNNKSGQRVEYEEVIAVRRCPPPPLVYDLITGTENFLANGIVVHNCNTEIYKPLGHRADCKKMWQLDEDDFTVLIVAMNRVRKMIPRTLRVYKRFLENNPDVKSHLFLWTNVYPEAGTEEGAITLGISDRGVSLLPEIMELKLGEVVRFPDRADIPEWMGDNYNIISGRGQYDMVKLYNASDCVLLTSGGEAAGLPLLEGASCGVPGITTDYAGGPEYVGPGYAVPWHDYMVLSSGGARYALVDIDKAAEALTKIMNADREKLARRCRVFAERLSWENTISQYWRPFLSECEFELKPLLVKGEIKTWA